MIKVSEPEATRMSGKVKIIPTSIDEASAVTDIEVAPCIEALESNIPIPFDELLVIDLLVEPVEAARFTFAPFVPVASNTFQPVADVKAVAREAPEGVELLAKLVIVEMAEPLHEPIA